MEREERRVGRRAFVAFAGTAAVGLAGCSGTDGTGETTTGTAVSDAEVPSYDGSVGYTYQRPTGNRVVAGEGAVPEAAPIDVRVDWTPAWVVGVSGEASAGNADRTASRWAIVGESGQVAGVRIRDGKASTAAVAPADLPTGTPPVLRAGRPSEILTAPESATDPRATHPVAVEDGLLSISERGDLVLWDDENPRTERDRLALDALPDARIVTAGGADRRGAGGAERRAFVFADATTRYDHAVLGDGVEAGSVAIVDYRDGLSEVTRIRPNPADSAVFEGIAPILADLNGDDEREVVVTESDGERGARLVAFDSGGERLATGPAIGHGYGWRHQLAVAPFAPDGGVEVGAVRTPHVGQIAEFYRLDGGELQIVGEASGYFSHTMGSRNLDGGLAGDLEGDGRVELLVPTADRRRLGAVRRVGDGAEGAWEVELGGRLTTNLGAVESGGRVTIAAGWDRMVRFWSNPSNNYSY